MTWTRPPIGCHGPTTNSPEPKKSSQKTGRKEEEKKKPLPERTVDVMKPTPLCNAQGVLLPTTELHTRGKAIIQNTFLSPIRPSQVRVHTPISWHRVDCCYCCCYHFNSTVLPSRQEKKGKHHLYMYIFPPFP